MSVYHRVILSTANHSQNAFSTSTTTTSLTQSNTSTIRLGFNYDETLVFEGEDKVRVEALTSVIIIFLLISVVVNFGIIVVSILCSSKCCQRKLYKNYCQCLEPHTTTTGAKTHTLQDAKILSTIYVQHDIQSLTVEEVQCIFSQYGYTNIDIDGAHLNFLFQLEDVNAVLAAVRPHLLVTNSLGARSDIDAHQFSIDFESIQNKYKPHSCQDLYEIIKRKLEAEISVGVLSAIIMGFSVSIYKIENYRNYHDPLFNILNYVHVFIQSLVSGLSMLNVISSTTIYFQGMSIISRQHRNNAAMLTDFNTWWHRISMIRKLIRYCFIYCLPLFLLSFITNPDIWINNIYLAVFNLVIIYTSVIFGTVAYCKFNFR